MLLIPGHSPGVRMIDSRTMEKESLLARVEAVLEQIRPAIQGDGGDVELMDVVGGVVQIRLAGACVGCRDRAHGVRGRA